MKKDIISHPDKYSVWLKIALNRIKSSQIKEAIKLLKGFEQIKHIEILFANSLVIIKDKKECYFSTGALSKEDLEISYNIGLLSKEKDDVNIMINFFKKHVPSFMTV